MRRIQHDLRGCIIYSPKEGYEANGRKNPYAPGSISYDYLGVAHRELEALGPNVICRNSPIIYGESIRDGYFSTDDGKPTALQYRRATIRYFHRCEGITKQTIKPKGVST